MDDSSLTPPVAGSAGAAGAAPGRAPAVPPAAGSDGFVHSDQRVLDRQIFYLHAIAQIGKTLAGVGTLEQLLPQVVDYFTEIAGVRWTCVYLRDARSDGYRLRESKFVVAEPGWSAPDAVPDRDVAELWKGAPPLRRVGSGVFGSAPGRLQFLPLFTEGAPTGFLLFGAKLDGSELVPDEAAFLSTLATQAALAIRHVSLLDETARMVEELTVLNEISRLLTHGSEPFSSGLNAMWARLQPFLRLEWALLLTLRDGADEAVLGEWPHGQGQRERIQRWCTLLLDESERGSLLRRGEVVLLDGAEVESSFPVEFRPAAGAGHTFTLIPLFYDEELEAILLMRAVGGRDRFQGYRRMLQHLSPTLSSALQKARDHVKLERLATTDGLTALYNHRYFHERLQQEYLRAYRLKERLALLFVDVDHFKSINDAFGHLYGDEVLARIAEVLRTGVREIDVAARYGGEEFAIILPEASSEEALAIGERVRFAVEHTLPVRLARKIHRLTVSVGVACYPENASTKQKLVEAADGALYLAKRAGRNRVVVAEPEGA